MLLQAIAYWVFAAVTVASAAMVVTSRNPVYSVLFLILAFFNTAALFVLIGAEFIAMILVIVYVGAVAVLFLFVVTMLDVDFAELKQSVGQYLFYGLIIGAALLMRVETSFRLFGYPGLAILLFLAAAAGGLMLVISIVMNDIKARHKIKV